MNTLLKQTVMFSSSALGLAALIAMRYSGASLGIIVGGAWNIINIFCLIKLLSSWLGPRTPSKKQVISWILLKFPLVYYLAFWILSKELVAISWFAVGFTIVLFAMVITVVVRGPKFSVRQANGG